MANLPDDPSCVVHDGERVELLDEHVVMPDGSTRVDLRGCTLETGAVMVIEYNDPPPPHHRHVPPPEDVSPPDAVSDSTDATTVAMLPPAPPPLPPQAAVNPVTVAIAVSATGTAGALGWKAVKALKGPTVQQTQQAEEKRQRAECGTRSDSVLTDFRAHTADFKTRQLVQVSEPTELWQRADALDAQVEQLQRFLRASAKTRRA